jgi:hypothetical protein
LFGGAGTEVKIPTLPLKTREGWGTRSLSAVFVGEFLDCGCAFLFGGAGTEVKIPTLPLKTREGWGTPGFESRS